MNINLNTSTVGAGNIALGQGSEVKPHGAALKPLLGGGNIEVSEPFVDISKLIDTLNEENKSVAESIKRRFNSISIEVLRTLNGKDIDVINALSLEIENLAKLNEALRTKQEDRIKYFDDKEKLDEIDEKISDINKDITGSTALIEKLATQLSSATKRELGALFADMGVIEAPPEGKERLEEDEKAIVFAFLHIPTDQHDAVIQHLQKQRASLEEMQNILNDIDSNRQEMV